jgi:inner membrane protein
VDNLTHFAFGAAVGVAVMGRRTQPWKAALWGGICCNLPDVDVFVPYGDPIRDMTYHRGSTHSLLYLTLVSPFLAWVVARIHREQQFIGRWWLAIWLALIAHPLLDVTTVYGTQLLRPFTDHPFGIGSIFIIDPLFSLPLMVCVIAALVMRSERRFRVNAIGLAIGIGYLGWGMLAQQYVSGIARESLRAQGIDAQRIEVDPTALNSILWRVIATTPGGYVEGYYSLLDEEPRIEFVRHPRDDALYERLKTDWNIDRMAWFTHGFFKVFERDGRVYVSDLRLGMEPIYTFTFDVGSMRGGEFAPETPRMAPSPAPRSSMLGWLWRRLKGEPLPPPTDSRAS